MGERRHNTYAVIGYLANGRREFLSTGLSFVMARTWIERGRLLNWPNGRGMK